MAAGLVVAGAGASCVGVISCLAKIGGLPSPDGSEGIAMPAAPPGSVTSREMLKMSERANEGRMQVLMVLEY